MDRCGVCFSRSSARAWKCSQEQFSKANSADAFGHLYFECFSESVKMSKMFADLIRQSKLITRDEFAANFGGIADDVVEMLNSDKSKTVMQEAREAMETAQPLPNGLPRFRQIDFGLFSTAPELEKGLVAAVDGTNALPIQMYSAGQALCVGIGSISHRRPMQDSLHYWSSKINLSEAKDSDDFI